MAFCPAAWNLATVAALLSKPSKSDACTGWIFGVPCNCQYHVRDLGGVHCAAADAARQSETASTVRKMRLIIAHRPDLPSSLRPLAPYETLGPRARWWVLPSPRSFLTDALGESTIRHTSPTASSGFGS